MTVKLEPLVEKFISFGWNVHEIDGHDHQSLKENLKVRDRYMPTVIIANTIKGKGVSFMENEVEWHYRIPLDEFFKQAIRELEIAEI